MANSASFSDQIPPIYGAGGGGLFDGYLDMLDYCGGPSLFELLQQPSPAPVVETNNYNSEVAVVNTPTTNSSSISSSSNEPLNDHTDQDNNNRRADDDDQDNHANKQLNVKKKNPKKTKEARFAFMTKTEVDHLDDGYRWRKYGQKAVKNSPFPRSYYRCTSISCGVKKRVERSSEDPSTVVTTYEGTHKHPCPTPPRGFLPETATYGGLNGGSGSSSGGSSYLLPAHQLLYYPQPPQSFFHNHQTNTSNLINTTIAAANDPSSYTQYAPTMTSSFLLRDDGLLQDMVSFQTSKELETKQEPC